MKMATASVLAMAILGAADPRPQDRKTLEEACADQALKLAEDFYKAGDLDAARFLAGLVASKAVPASELAGKLIEAIKASTAKPTPAKDAETKIAALGKRWAGEWRKVGKGDARLAVEAEIFDALGEHAKAFALFNRRRAEAGIGRVDYDFTLSYGCQLHAKYLALHPDEENPHSETEGKAGYSEEGKKAAENSVIGWGATLVADVEGQLATLYHRTNLIDPETARTGFGFSSGKSGKVTVIDTLSALVSAQNQEAWVAFPPKGATDVFLQMEPENPTPVPSDVEDKVGYPISVSFFRDSDQVTDVAASLRSGMTAIDCFQSSPDKPATASKENNKGIIGLIPKKALTARTEYAVSIKCKYRGEDLKIEWTFKTGVAQRP